MSVDIKLEAPDVAKQVAKFARFNEISNKHLVQGMNSSLLVVKSGIKRETPVGVSSRLRGSIDSELTQTPISITGKVGSTLNEPYPSVINFGRKTGWFPPPSALERWVQVKLGVSGKAVKGVAFAVARKISRSGIRGRHFMEKGFEATKGRVYGFFDRALERIAKELSIG